MRKFPFCSVSRGPFRGLRIPLFVLGLWVLGWAAACNPPITKKIQANALSDSVAPPSQIAIVDTQNAKKHDLDPQPPTSRDDTQVGERYPLPEHLHRQKELLLKYSQPVTATIIPDGEYLEGKFNSGVIELILEEIDGEPSYFYGHREETDAPVQMEFIAYGLPNEKLEQLVAEQKYLIHWMETVVDMKPYDDDRYRYFIVYQIDKSGSKLD